VRSLLARRKAVRRQDGTRVAQVPLASGMAALAAGARGGDAMGLREKLFGSKPKKDVDFSNVRSGSSTTAPAADASRGATPKRTPEGVPEAKTWTVRPGDTLSDIAKQVYGDASRWKAIYEANRSQIDDPDLIYPGQELVLPDSR
jgi:nucleoid-associated protein YgaU